MTFGENLTRLLNAASITQSELARRLKIKSQAVNQWCMARTAPKDVARMKDIADAIGVPVTEVLQFDGGISRAMAEGLGALPIARPASTLVSEVDVVASAGPGVADIDESTGHPVVATWQIPSDYLRSHTRSHAAVRVIRVAGDSMEPEYPSGDRVLVDTSHRAPSPPGVYILWDGFGLVLKRLEVLQGVEPPTVRISSSNPAYPPYERPAETLSINGRVVGKWMWK